MVMKLISLCLLFAFVFPNLVSAQISQGSKTLATAGIGSVSMDDPNSLVNNPAMLSTTGKRSLLLAYVPLYSIDGFYQGRSVLVFPIGPVAVAGGFQLLKAASLFQDMTFSVGSSFKFNEFISVGMAGHYLVRSVQFPATESSSYQSDIGSLEIDGGVSFFPLEKFYVAFVAHSLNNSRLSHKLDSAVLSDDRKFNLGFGFVPLKSLTLLSEIIFSSEAVPGLRLGVDSVFYDVVCIRAGLDENLRLSLGAGLSLAYFELDAGLQAHPQLGNLYQIDLTFRY